MKGLSEALGFHALNKNCLKQEMFKPRLSGKSKNVVGGTDDEKCHVTQLQKVTIDANQNV
jgi:hypothetical protein